MVKAALERLKNPKSNDTKMDKHAPDELDNAKSNSSIKVPFYQKPIFYMGISFAGLAALILWIRNGGIEYFFNK